MAIVDLAQAQRLRQRKRMGKTALVGFRRDDPDVVGKRARDAFENREPLRMDTVIIGQKNAHQVPQARVFEARQASHIGPQRVGNRDASVGFLIVLEHRDQRPADGDTRAVERMDEAGRLLARGTVARVHAPCLEVAADRAARNLAIGLLARQPDLDVIGLAGPRTPCRRSKARRCGRAGPARLSTSSAQPVMRSCSSIGRLGARDRDHLDLHELVLAQHAARVAARRTRLRAEAGRQRRQAHRQVRRLDDLTRARGWSAAPRRSESASGRRWCGTGPRRIWATGRCRTSPRRAPEAAERPPCSRARSYAGRA